MKSIISFDLDMTLLNPKTHKIPNSAMEAINRLRKSYYIVIATGRDMDNYFSRQFRDIIQANSIIHSNGAKITAGSEVIYETYMSNSLVKAVLKFAERENLSVGATLGDYDYYTHTEQVIERDRKIWGELKRQYNDPWKLLDKKIYTLAYVGEAKGARKIEQEFPELKCPLCEDIKGADIVKKRNSKAKGLQFLCNYWETDIKNTYAFGDSMNDYEILKAAGTGIAMGNAVSELKEIADYVTTGIDDDGILKACEHFHLI